jgi:hypothetical protein
LCAAREKVRVARALESLPRISAAMERGELSYSKIRAIARVADAATEELLLSIALRRQCISRTLNPPLAAFW